MNADAPLPRADATPPAGAMSDAAPATAPSAGRAAEVDQGRYQAPRVTLPKGGGAIRGIGEKFSVNSVNGTASLTVPIPVSPARSGFGPQLTLTYDSGAGNGPFGVGWSLGLPSITRKTDKGLPTYDDAGESDEFVLSGAEDLVPVTMSPPLPDRELNGVPYAVIRYRPRIEGLFARIERWTARATGETHWRSISQDNITTRYGLTAESRIADPDDPRRVSSWLICQSHDDKGNAVIYSYRPENAARIFEAAGDQPPAFAHERNRDPGDSPADPRSANRYPWRIRYGNRAPNRDAAWQATDPAALDDNDWMFSVVFDYGDDHYSEQVSDEAEVFATARAAAPADNRWPARPDRFSSYRAGFEVRTYRLCRRALMFHHFPAELGIADCLVRATDYGYAENPVATTLSSVTQSGFTRVPEPTNQHRYRKRSLPTLELGYSRVPTGAELADQPIAEFDGADLDHLPYGVDGAVYQWLDLDGEGAPGILTEQADAWWYTRNMSANNVDDAGRSVARFGPAELVRAKPNASLGRGGAQFMDLAGDGQNDLVQMDGPARGLYERTSDAGWHSFRPFVAWPNVDPNDPRLRFVDLDGDGLTDILVAEHESFRWYRSLAEDGFAGGRRTPVSLDEEKGPRLTFADGTNSVYLADMSGDGLSDLVRVRNGEICYWPNLGYGRFGSRVVMDDAPWFDVPELFDPRRIRLADIDGSGVTDVIYLSRDGVRLYFNQSGNRWSAAATLPRFAPLDNLATVQTVDLLGSGTICLVWSSPLPSRARRPMHYLDLMGGTKPHLLQTINNNLGAETRLDFAPSTRFYLDDRAAGTPWVTRLAFPVQCVARMETIDWISRNRFATTYSYHHGYFDGEEREFRGFGRVEQRDSETFATLTAAGDMPAAGNLDAAAHVPPMLTKTWFHTGAYLERERVSRLFAAEYSPPTGEDGDVAAPWSLADTLLPAGLTVAEEREACRALKGMMLRHETFALDGSEREHRPYTVVEQNFAIKRLQPRAGNRHAVFLTHPAEAITFQYERNVDDPRIAHALTLEADAFGNVLKSAAAGYRRLIDPDPSELTLPADQERQTTTLVTYTEHTFTDPISDAADDYRAPLPCESRTYELVGYAPAGPDIRYQPADFVTPAADAVRGPDDGEFSRLDHRYETEVAYETTTAATNQRRLIAHTRTVYRPDDLGAAALDPLALLPLGQAGTLALPGESYQLAFTPGLLAQVYQRPLDALAPADAPPPTPLLPAPADVLPVDPATGRAFDRGGYVSSETLRSRGIFPPDDDATAWTRSDEDGHWWLPSGRVFYSPGPDDSPAAELTNARPRFFLPHRVRDPFGANATVAYDDHALLPVLTRDAVGNATSAGERDAAGNLIAPTIDYRTLQPALVTDPNGNRAAVAFDALGLVVGTAVMGKAAPTPAEGDNLNDFAADLTRREIDEVLAAADPRQPARTHLAAATTRIIHDVDRFQRTRRAHPGDPADPAVLEQWLPAVVATVARERHVADLAPGEASAIQIGFAYSDGFGRDIQKKIQAEPGPVVGGGEDVSPRWVGSGWTIFNNKGKPVRQYEPFFSQLSEQGHRYELGVAVGVSPILFYDPPGRVVATLHPNHTYEKVVFDPWRQTTYDANDTAAPFGEAGEAGHQTGDPRTDPDIAGYVAAYFAGLDNPAAWRTWHDQRRGGEKGPREQRAATRAGGHANTPTIAHFDALGRPFITFAHNGFGTDGAARLLPARVELDIEGNQRTVRDAVVASAGQPGRVVARYHYDMLGNRIHQASLEAGERWLLNDGTGKTIRAWDSRGHAFSTDYDPLRRPLRSTVAGADPARPEAAHLVERLIYGEQIPNAQALNLRGQLHRHCDQAGVTTTEAHDFKGNPVRASRRLARVYKETVDWRDLDAALPTEATAALTATEEAAVATALDQIAEAETFRSATRYDALNRAVQVVPPHGDQAGAGLNVIQPVYNEANLLEGIQVWLDVAAAPDGLLDPATLPPARAGVANIDYDAKGQRQRIDYQNGTSTFYQYDPETFRLTALYTRRSAAFTADCGGESPPPLFAAPDTPPANTPCGLQNLRYTYDPVGNIMDIRDAAQQTIYFRNRRVEPSAEYAYDPLYRLTSATGREHLGQTGGTPIPHSYNDRPRAHLPHPGDSDAMGPYEESYAYDDVGNFTTMRHRSLVAGVDGWTRTYAYAEPSLLEPGTLSNRLTSTTVGTAPTESYGGPDGYDPHGNMLKMPQLAILQWDFKDQLRMTQRQAVNVEDTDGTARQGERTWYVYDAAGQRVRKVTELATGARKDERLYLGGVEIYRRHGAAPLSRETLHVMDDTRRIALAETRTSGDDGSPRELIRVQFSNHLGTACLELDDDADIISYEEYSPYGSTLYQAVRDQGEPLKRYRFTGKERDDETGFTYHGARYFAPWLGRWTSCDPAGTVDGPNLYRYARNNPNRLIDPAGRQSHDPTSPPTVSGFGVTIGGGKVVVGPLTPPPGSACDELNPLCKGVTIKTEPKPQVEPTDGESGEQEASSPFDPFSWVKTYSKGPNPGVVWRRTNPLVDPNPLRFGFAPKDPNAKFTPGQHALGEHLPKGSQYVSGSHKPGGATNFQGEPFAIDPAKTQASGTKFHDTPEIAADMDRMAREGQVSGKRVEAWKGAQQTTEGVPTKPGQPPKGEVLFEGRIPPEAVESKGIRAAKGAGRALTFLGIALTAFDVGYALAESIDQESPKPIAKELVRQAGTWGGVVGGAKGGAFVGSFAGPIGTVVGGIAGGLVGGAIGYLAGSWVADLF